MSPSRARSRPYATGVRYGHARVRGLNAAQTHDPLWNVTQRDLVATGTIHNHLRMLWGTKVIEWSRTRPTPTPPSST